jgi:uncharacterized surface protein with fasciclin (FAS1) repeats
MKSTSIGEIMIVKKNAKLSALALVVTMSAGAFIGIPQAQAAATGTNSLAAVLTAKNSFDTNSKNYDIITAAILAVLKAKPDSPVKVLTDGTMAVTAFIPNDGAFKNLVTALTKKSPKTEADAFATVAGLGIDTVEMILEYHVVPGPAILSAAALKANGVVLKTALMDKTVKVSVMGTTIKLLAFNKMLRTPKVILSQVDINKGNLQVAHGIDAVLMPTK